ncbi:MAG: thiol-disulfide oxidoreductase DCC family protein [Halobacteriales archaeon]
MPDPIEQRAEILLPAERPIVLYDGVCNLCNGVVQFALPRDSARRYRFAPLQSAPGQALLEHFGMETDDHSTFVLVEGRDAYVRSTAALRLARGLDLPWSAFGALLAVPRPLRDAVYDLVARHRYRVFGRKDRCRRPPSDRGDVFLDGADAIPGEP